MFKRLVLVAPVLALAALLSAPAVSQGQGYVRFAGPNYYGPGYFGGYNWGYRSQYSAYPGSWYGSYNSPRISYYSYPSIYTWPGYSYSYPSSYYSYPITPYYYPSSGFVTRPAISTYSSSYPSEMVTRPVVSDQDRVAHVRVLVPTDAEVWFDDIRMQQTGTSRLFVSPVLNPDKNYSYEVKARWTENGKAVERSKTISVQSGKQTVVNFTD